MSYDELPAEFRAAMERHRENAELKSLANEVAFARALLERSEKNPTLSVQLLQTICRLVREMDLLDERARQTIRKDEMMRLVGSLVNLFVREFENSCPDWQDRIDRITTEWAGLLEPPKDN